MTTPSTRPDRTDLDKALAAWRIAWTIFPAAHAMIAVMDERPGWHRVVELNGVVIHARDEPR